MKKIEIQKIKVFNFGGVANGEYDFNNNVNILEGKSGSGKSTAYNAYLWALGFNIPTWEPKIEGYRLYKTKTEVIVDLKVGDLFYSISKTNEPKYKPNKFTGEEEYIGTDFKYFIDGQELNATTFKDKIAEIYGVDYFTLELVSVIELFNTEDGKRWDKNERRKYLFKLFDLDNKINELVNNPEFEPIKDYLLKGQDELSINQALNTLKTNIDKELNDNQVIVGEKQKELAEYNSIDFSALEKQKTQIQVEIDTLNKQTQESNKNTLIAEKNKEIAQIQAEINKITNEYNEQELNYQRNTHFIQNEIKKLEENIEFNKNKITKIENTLADLEIDKSNLNEEVFDEQKASCPTCKQSLPVGKVEELKANFENDKKARLEKLEQEIKNNESMKQSSVVAVDIDNNQKEKLAKDLEALVKPQEPSFVEQEEKIGALKKEIEGVCDSTTTELVNQKLMDLNTQYENIIRELSKKENIEKITARINELKERSRELGIQDAERVAKKTALQKYTAQKVALVNEQVNKYFEGVSYNFFKFLSASANAEYQNICEVVMNGTEYEAMSSGQKVKANLYTNNSLRKILGLNIPQFVDDVVLSDLQNDEKDWQTIYLLTNNNKKLNLTLVKDIYTLEDCDVRR